MPPRQIALVVFFATVAIRLPLLSTPGFPADQTQFVHWAYLTKSAGLASVYERQPNGRFICNYPPGYVFILRGLAEFQGIMAPSGAGLTESTAASIWNRSPDTSAIFAMRLHKVPAMLADAVLAAILLVLLRERLRPTAALMVAGLYAVSPAVLHDSCIWGQVDAIHTLFLVLSVEAIRRKSIGWMAFWATASLLFKAQSIILAPHWAAAAWTHLRTDRKAIVRILGSAVLPMVVMLMPFSRQWEGIWNAYTGATATYPFTHLNGFSSWFFSAPMAAPHLSEDLRQWYVRDDQPWAFGLPARTIGIVCLLLLWACVVFKLIRSRLDDSSLRWGVRILPLGFFVLSTQMHERYLFPAIALWAWSASASARWWTAWLALSLCVAANMVWVWGGPIESVQNALRECVPVGTLCAGALCLVAIVAWFDRLDTTRRVDATAI
ncbi:MAG: hypothetical protein HZA51_09875 [Planctomycetes bacterium]|nr:hypothetical protein [Planctomycetota bacterium]